MADEQGATINLKMALDRAALQQSQDGVTVLDKRLSDLKAHVADTGTTADRSIRTLADAFKGSVTQIDANTKAIQAFRSQLQGAANDGKKLSSGGGFSVESLRRTGGALSQLGAGDAGGLIARLGDIGQIGKEVTSLIDALGPLAPLLSGVAGAVIGFQLGLKVLDAELADAKRAFDSALDTQKDYYQFAAKATTEEAQARKKQLEDQQTTAQAMLDETNATIKRMEEQFGVSFEVLKKAPGEVGAAAQKLSQQWDENTKAVNDAGIAIGRLDGALQSGAFAANDAAKATEDYNKALVDGIQRNADQQRQLLADDKLSLDAGRKRLDSLKDERQVIVDEMNALQGLTDTNEAAKKKYDELNDKFAELTVEIDHLAKVSVPAAKGLADFNDFLKKLKAEADRIAKEVNERNARVAETQKKYEDDVARIEDEALQKRADIEKKYADKQVEIARQAADAAQAALTKLTQAREDLAITLGRDEQKAERDAETKRLDIQIAAQREEVKAYRDHQRELEQIRKDAAAREIGFLLDRNFLGLYQSRLQTSRDITRSNDQFVASRQDRQQSAQQQLEDLQRQTQRERQERLIAYQQQLADAQLAYKRELQLAQSKRAQELQLARQEHDASLRDAQAATATALRIRQQAYTKELQLVSLYGAAYVKANDQIMQALVTRAEQRLALVNGTSGGSTNTVINGDVRRLLQRAGGGPLSAGQTALVNDGSGRERFNGVPFPPGLGLFTPLRAGNVQSAGAPGNFTINVYPSPGMNEEALAHKTLDLIEKVIGR